MKKTVLMKRLLAVLVVLVMTIAPAVTAFAVPATVNDAKSGVFTIVYCYPNPESSSYAFAASYGSGFLINDDGVIVTCHHVLHLEDTADGVALMNSLRAADKNYLSKMQIRVYYKAGAYYLAKEIDKFRNSEYDYTAVQLVDSISGHDVLPLMENLEDELVPSSPVYALGYPYDTTTFNYTADRNALTSKDCDIRDGIFSKFSRGGDMQHTAQLTSGMSGGPLIDENGAVVGINAWHLNGNDEANYAVPISEVINSLKTTNIEYTSAGSTPPVTTTAQNNEGNGGIEEITTVPPTEPAVNTAKLDEAIAAAEAKINAPDKYSEEDINKLKDAVAAAKTAKDSATKDADIDSAAATLNAATEACKEKGGMNKTLLIGIIAGALVLIAIIVIIIIVVSSKKKKTDNNDIQIPGSMSGPGPIPGPTPGPGPMPGSFGQGAGGFNSNPIMPASTFQPRVGGGDDLATDVLSTKASETTVLGAGSNDTTVLNSRPYAKLTRKSNGEIIQIGSDPFIIGKERRRVNYCIEDNATVSRNHAKIVKSGSKVAIVDMGSKNGTFVNGVKCTSNVAVDLNEGDKITLSDEEFTFNTL